MPKTSNLRSELTEIKQASDNSFTISVLVWEMPGGKGGEDAVRFRFKSHANPALWWRLNMTEAAQVNPSDRKRQKYTNAQYNKALRTATDALNAYIVRESDERTPGSSGSAKKMAKNRGALPLRTLRYGALPSETDFFLSVSDRFDSPFAYYMMFDPPDAATVERAAHNGGIELAHRNGMTTLVSPRDMYNLIDSLRMLGTEMDNSRAMAIASALLEAAGFDWVRE